MLGLTPTVFPSTCFEGFLPDFWPPRLHRGKREGQAQKMSDWSGALGSALTSHRAPGSGHLAGPLFPVLHCGDTAYLQERTGEPGVTAAGGHTFLNPGKTRNWGNIPSPLSSSIQGGHWGKLSPGHVAILTLARCGTGAVQSPRGQGLLEHFLSGPGHRGSAVRQ